MTLKRAIEQALDFIADSETCIGTGGRDTKQYRDLAAAYDTICDKAAIAGIEIKSSSEK
jgi:hypothetical protein